MQWRATCCCPRNSPHAAQYCRLRPRSPWKNKTATAPGLVMPTERPALNCLLDWALFSARMPGLSAEGPHCALASQASVASVSRLRPYVSPGLRSSWPACRLSNASCFRHGYAAPLPEGRLQPYDSVSTQAFARVHSGRVHADPADLAAAKFASFDALSQLKPERCV